MPPIIRAISEIRALPPRIDSNIARCRLMLSCFAMAALLLEPSRPQLLAWIGSHHMLLPDHMLGIAMLSAHLLYSSIVYLLVRQRIQRPRLVVATTGADVLFAAAIGFATEGVGSPFFVFFTFALVAVGFRAGFRPVMLVAGISLALYLSMMRISAPDDLSFFIMRAVYLGIIGYLIGYLGQQRLNLEQELAELAAAERSTRIARELHDGCVQTLAAVNVKLATCAELLRRGQTDDVLAELAGLRKRVNVEHDSVRAYMRSLTRLRSRQARAKQPLVEHQTDTKFSVNVNFAGSGTVLDEVLQILREGIRNVRNHAHANSAAVTVRSDGVQVLVKIDDDGVGFEGEVEEPWTIASRVRELGGRLRINNGSSAGAHLEINLAQADPLGALLKA